MAFRDRLRAASLAWLLAGASGASADEPPRLELPIACEIGKSCFVQNYVDADPGPGSRDHECGSLSYDDHNGTDFRLPTMTAQRAGVDVLAAAPGRVLRRRDGVADISVNEIGRAAVKGSECGNAVVIEHVDGWETQYCHMARGSLRVEIGDRVEAGQPIGKVGLSGLTEYPHLHFILRNRGKIVDPFAYEAPPNACGGGRVLWQPALQAGLAYAPRTVLNTGFAAAPVTMAMLESGEAERQQPAADSLALLAYVRGIGLRAGDIQSLALTAPSGKVLTDHRAKPLERNQAQNLLFAGAKRPAGGWESGVYRALYQVLNDGKVVLERRFEMDIR